MKAEIRRVEQSVKLSAYQPGDMGQPHQADAIWCIACPGCGYRYRLVYHTVDQVFDGSITVLPSLLCTNIRCQAHFFVEANKIRYV